MFVRSSFFRGAYLFHLGRNDYRSSFQSRDTIKEVGDLNFATLGLYKALSLQANQIALSDKTKVKPSPEFATQQQFCTEL